MLRWHYTQTSITRVCHTNQGQSTDPVTVPIIGSPVTKMRCNGETIETHVLDKENGSLVDTGENKEYLTTFIKY
jgi:hypothetical protein